VIAGLTGAGFGYTLYIRRDAAMKVKISKWGNSLGLRLPKHLADELSLGPGKDVEIARDGTRLTIETAPAPMIPRYRLEDLLAQIKPGQKPPPFEDWGILESEWPAEDWSDIAPTDEEWEAWKKEAEQRGALKRRRRA
jgi:antitoxin MazE